MNPEGSAFEHGVEVGDVLVAVDNIVMSAPSISLGEARDRLMDAKDFWRETNTAEYCSSGSIAQRQGEGGSSGREDSGAEQGYTI